MNIPNSSVRQILDNIPDTKQRDLIANILSGKIVKEVRCLNDKPWYKNENGKRIKIKPCNGRLIAHIYSDGKIRMAASEGKAWLRAIRYRLDGSLGFECWCGNDSRLCEAEKGVTGIEQNTVTKEDIEEVWDNLQKKPANYPISKGKQVIDGFEIREIK